MTSLSCSPSELATRLLAGEAAILPTDTLPALASRPEAANLLWELKQRPRHKPVILMAATSEALLHCLGRAIEPAWQQMADRYWPGALTLVLPAQGAWLEQLNPGGTTLGLRLPACQAALELLALSGPLATTSANRSGQPAATTAAEAARQFPGLALLEPLPWPPGSGQASTVLAWRGEERSDDPWAVLRPGATPAPGAGGV